MFATILASMPSMRPCKPAAVAVVGQAFAVTFWNWARNALRAKACRWSRLLAFGSLSSFSMKRLSARRSLWQAVAAATRIRDPHRASRLSLRSSPVLTSPTSAPAAESIRPSAAVTASVVSAQSVPLANALVSAALQSASSLAAAR